MNTHAYTSDTLDIEAITQSLLKMGHSVPLFFFDSIDSTMDEARRFIHSGVPTPFIIAAGKQTAGRGRMGRVWFADDASNFYFTFSLPFKGDLHRLQHLTLWVGELFATYLNAVLGLEVYLKIPNDLHAGGQKLAGMLVETMSDPVHAINFGIGLNVNSDPKTWPNELKDVAVSLSQLAGKPIPFNRLAAALITLMVEGYAFFMSIASLDRLDPRAYVESRLQTWPRALSLR